MSSSRSDGMPMDYWTITACELLVASEATRKASLDEATPRVRASLECVMRQITRGGDGRARQLLDEWQAANAPAINR